MVAKNFAAYSDEELVGLIQSGDESVLDYLMEKYKGLVKKKARVMFLIGGDNDDLIQEGMIGLYKAVRNYNPDKESSFYHFADICIARQIYTAVEASNRKKHKPLNSYLSLDSGMITRDEHLIPIQEVLQSLTERNPEELLIDKEEVYQREVFLREHLSAFEREVLKLYLLGKEYLEIAEEMDKTPKSIDNALQRIKLKVGRNNM